MYELPGDSRINKHVSTLQDGYASRRKKEASCCACTYTKPRSWLQRYLLLQERCLSLCAPRRKRVVCRIVRRRTSNRCPFQLSELGVFSPRQQLFLFSYSGRLAPRKQKSKLGMQNICGLFYAGYQNYSAPRYGRSDSTV